jgi:hypothetical protein
MAMLTHDYERSYRPRQPPLRPAAATALVASIKCFGRCALGTLLGCRHYRHQDRGLFRALRSRRRLTPVMRRGMISSASRRSVGNVLLGGVPRQIERLFGNCQKFCVRAPL